MTIGDGTDPDDPRVRFRLYVEGACIDEAWIDVSIPGWQDEGDIVGEAHAALARAAMGLGFGGVHVEFHDPATGVTHRFYPG
jgi:hypothetical protein